GTTLTGPITAAELTANRSAASAWAGPSAWRASRPEFRPTLRLATGGQTMEVVADADRVDSDADGLWRVVLGGVQHTARIFSDAGERTIWVSTDRGIHVFTRPLADSSLTPGLEGAEVLAPMPGAVVAVRVDTGDRVDQGDPIVVVEAMKMEHVLTAPAAGIVSVTAVEGAQVGLDEVLATDVAEDIAGEAGIGERADRSLETNRAGDRTAAPAPAEQLRPPRPRQPRHRRGRKPWRPLSRACCPKNTKTCAKGWRSSPTTKSHPCPPSSMPSTSSPTPSSPRWGRWGCSVCPSTRSTAAWAATTSPCAWPSRRSAGSTSRWRSPSRPESPWERCRSTGSAPKSRSANGCPNSPTPPDSAPSA